MWSGQIVHGVDEKHAQPSLEALPTDAAAESMAAGLGRHVATWVRSAPSWWQTALFLLGLVVGTVRLWHSVTETDPARHPWAFGMVAVGFVLMALILALAAWALLDPRGRQERVYAFTGGLVQRDRRGALHAVAWADVSMINRKAARTRAGHPTQWRYAIRVGEVSELVIDSSSYSDAQGLSAFVDREAERHGLAVTGA